MATAQQTLDIARNEIGYKESPAGSNKQKYVPRAEPWCVDFINWCCARVGLDLPGSPTSSVYTLRQHFIDAGRLYDTPLLATSASGPTAPATLSSLSQRHSMAARSSTSAATLRRVTAAQTTAARLLVSVAAFRSSALASADPSTPTRRNLRSHHHRRTTCPTAASNTTQAPRLESTPLATSSDCIDEILGHGTPAQRKALIEQLVDELHIVGPNRIQPIYRIPRPYESGEEAPSDEDAVRTMGNLVGDTGIEPAASSVSGCALH
jgi:hypothetical protein